MENRYVSIRKTAERTGVPEFRLRAWKAQGKLPGFSAASRYYVDLVSFQAQLDEMCQASVSQGVGENA